MELVTLENSWPSLTNSAAGGPNYPARGSSMPTSCRISISFNYCCEGKVGYLTDKNPPTEISVHSLFSVFEMLSWLHKTYSFKTLDFNDIKKPLSQLSPYYKCEFESKTNESLNPPGLELLQKRSKVLFLHCWLWRHYRIVDWHF